MINFFRTQKIPMKKTFSFLLAGLLFVTCCQANNDTDTLNAGLSLPKGFQASKIAEGYGRIRHLLVTPEGVIYARTSKLYKGNGVLKMTDLNGDDKIDKVEGLGNYSGTGIAMKDGYLYASSDDDVFRYKLNATNEVMDAGHPEKIITGLWNKRQHESKSIVLDNNGNIYVNIGAPSNACQEVDRANGSKGRMPCPILDSAGGIWMFKADKLNQSYAQGVRYATGLRNIVGLDWNTQTNSLFVMQHGRDNLLQNWPEYYDSVQSAELPSECMYELKKGDNAGWPYIYYDQIRQRKMLAPEYGGDGKTESPRAKDYIEPIVAFPGHLAPNALLFYTGNMFPEKYRNGAFITFHGSWNRAPLPQAGYCVAFVPFKNGKPSGNWEIFADGFAGVKVVNSTRQAEHRPCGLAQGPDGALYVSDDNKGAIYRISYSTK
jgi:glucose/arabinose dehydrogenase